MLHEVFASKTPQNVHPCIAQTDQHATLHSQLKLGDGMLLQEKNGKIYKVCDTVEYDELHTDDEVIKVALSEENMIIGTNFFNTSFVFAD